MGRRWTEEETRVLLMGLGAYGIEWFRKRTGTAYRHPNAPQRSVDALVSRIRRVCGTSRFVRGAYTLTALVKRSGYSATQIRRAQTALNQKWKRTSLRGSFLITDEQSEELTAWLQHDFWSRKRRLYGCVQCGEDSVRPKVWGLCQRCYKRVYRAVGRLRRSLPPEDQTFLDQFVQKVRAGRGFGWQQLRELTRRSRSRSVVSS